ncbi:sperm-tail PG-rich repeat-containing protein 2 [Mergus octosetaceus]
MGQPLDSSYGGHNCSPRYQNLATETVLHYENVNIKKKARKKYDLLIPWYHEVIELQEEKKSFVHVKSITPTPGTYNEPHTALKSLNKTSGMKKIQFRQTALRFAQDCRLVYTLVSDTEESEVGIVQKMTESNIGKCLTFEVLL